MASYPAPIGSRSGTKAKSSSRKLRCKDEIITTFRPHDDVKDDYVGIVEWCEQQTPPNSVSSVLNSFIPAIYYTLLNLTFVDPASGRTYMRANFGDVLLREPRVSNTIL